MTIFFFSATGNSLAVAKQFGGNLISIPQVINDSKTQYKDDVIGLVFPIYSTAPPKMVSGFLNKITLEADYTFAIGTYGNMDGACMYNVQKLAQKRGYRFDYANSLLMLDNYLPVFEIEAEIQKMPKKRVEEKTAKIAADIKNRIKLQAKASILMRALASILKVFTSALEGAKGYIVNSGCTKCGTCEKVCPAKNIEVKGKVHFGGHCEACLACVHLCPKNAIHLKNEKSGKRWRNPDVSLSELIKANNRLK
ncbi:MAG: 4Fe-4S dicluster domain-containing protein [Clostridiales bacterium]|jgi:ferredoxin|nr:4Fe-4S dicluster domain-containing protein [Clostridiales bacterium]